MGNWKNKKMHMGGYFVSLFVLFLLIFSSPVSAGIEEGQGEYEIYPTPQSVEYGDATAKTSLTQFVNVTCGKDIDDYTQARIDDTLEVQNSLRAYASSEFKDTNTKLIVGVYGSGDEADAYRKEHGADVDEAIYTAEDKYDAYTLWIDDGQIVILGEDTDAAYYGVTTLKRILEQIEKEDDTTQIRDLTITDYAEVEFRGFIEGYYGTPWSTEDRVDLMQFGGEIKMNQYIYAPKDDPYHSAKWRDLYTEEDLEGVKTLAEAGNESKCFFVYALHTFLHNPINFNNYDAELKVVQAKFEQVIKYAGVRQIAILEDDATGDTQENITRYLTDMHNWLVELKKEIPDLKTDLLYCPNCYMNTTNDKMTYISEHTDKEIHFLVTGGTIWGHVTEEFATGFYEGLGGADSTSARYPYMWVNWPCNDATKTSQIMGGHNYILEAGITGSHYEGVVLNPIQESEPSKVGIFTASDYCWNIWQNAAEGDQAWEDAFKYIDHMTAIETNSSDALKEAAKHQIAQASNQPQTPFEESVEIKDKLNAFTGKLSAGTYTEAEIAELKTEFEKIYDAAVFYMKYGENKRMVKQMTPFLSCLRDLAQANIRLMDIMQAILNEDNTGIWKNYADAQALYESSKKHGFSYYGLGTIYAQAGRKYIAPFTKEVLKYVSKKVSLIVNGEKEVELGEAYTVSDSDISSNMNGYGTPLTNLIDADETNIFWSNRGANVGDYIQLDLGSIKKVGYMQAMMGKGDSADKWTQYHVEHSLDGVSWVALKTYNSEKSGEEDYLADLKGVLARYVRLVNDKADSNWSKFRGIKVYAGTQEQAGEEKYEIANVSTSGNWGTYNNQNESYLTDGNDGTYVWYATSGDRCNVGDFVQVNLGTVKKIGRVRVAVGAGDGDKFKNYHLEYSKTEDGPWQKLPVMSGKESGTDSYCVNLDGAEAQYLRIVSDGEGGWVKFSEFSVYSYVEGMEVRYPATLTYTEELNYGSQKTVSQLLSDDPTTFASFEVRWNSNGYAGENGNACIEGDYVQLDLGSDKSVGRIKVLMGSTGNGDKWKKYHLEYKKQSDADWNRLDEYEGLDSGIDYCYSSLGGEKARYIRLVNDELKGSWLRITEFSVYSYSEEPIDPRVKYIGTITHSPEWNNPSYGNLFDEDDETYVEYATRNSNDYQKKDHSLKDDFIQLDLNAAKAVGTVRIVLGGASNLKNKWLKYHLEYSKTGADDDWTALAGVTGKDEGTDIYTVDLEGKKVRYLKLVNDEDRAQWIAFSEFSVYPYVQMNKLYANMTDSDNWDVTTDKKNDTYSLDSEEGATKQITLQNGEYIGIELDGIHEIEKIVKDLTSGETLTLESSRNGVEWTTVAAGGTYNARYVRLINKTNDPVTFTINSFIIKTNEIKQKSFVEATIGVENGNWDARQQGITLNWIDGDLSTKASYASSPEQGDYILYDLGQEIDIRSIRAYVLDTATDYPRHAEIQVSSTNTQDSVWTPILTFNSTQDESVKPVKPVENGWTHDTIDPSYAYLENTEVSNVKGRYIKLYFTQDGSRWVELNEIQINGGEYMPTEKNLEFETDAKPQEGFELSNLTDGDLTTSFQPSDESSYLIYHFSKDVEQINRINILQSENSVSSDTKVYVRTDAPQAAKAVSVRAADAGGWQEVGTLYRSFSSFYTKNLDNVYAVKIEWDNTVVPVIYEIMAQSDEGDVLEKNVTDAESQINIADAELAEIATNIGTLESTQTEQETVMNNAEADTKAQYFAQEAYYTTSAELLAEQIRQAEQNAVKAVGEAELARAEAQKLRAQAAELTGDEAATKITEAEQKEAKIQTKLDTAAAELGKIDALKTAQQENEAKAKEANAKYVEATTEYWNVTYKYNDNTTADKVEKIAKNTKLEKPEDPAENDGQIFVAWYMDEELTELYPFGRKVIGDITLYAKWSEPWIVTFDSKGGSTVPQQKVPKGEALKVAPTDPSRTDYKFDGWYSDEALQNKYDFTSPVTDNITLYAKWIKKHTVTFNSNDGSEVAPQKVVNGECATVPPVPTKGTDQFLGWYSDAALQNEYDFTNPVTGDITLYAKWQTGSSEEKTKWTVTFESNGGSSVEAQEIVDGAYATKPTEPTKGTNQFLGWYDKALQNEYDFENTPVTANITLYAKWQTGSSEEKTKWTVTFESNGGSEVASQTISDGETATEPPGPTRAGYTFTGWYTEKELKTKYDFNSPVKGAIKLYAGWTANSEKKDEPITDLKFAAGKYKIAAGQKIDLNEELTILPENATNKNLNWEVSNTEYARVNNGVVTLLKKGAGKQVTITAKAADGSGKDVSVTIQIMKHKVKKVTLKAAKTVKAGKTVKIKATVKTTGKNVNKTLKWTSSNPEYATVDKKGKVKTLKAGKGKTVTITAISTDGTKKKKSVKIKIK